VPVILAGGLTPENVVEAATLVRPYAVDVASGVEAYPGVKDHEKMQAFIAACRGV
jgi:phosphoribosylanthranilate isomerase